MGEYPGVTQDLLVSDLNDQGWIVGWIGGFDRIQINTLTPYWIVGGAE